MNTPATATPLPAAPSLSAWARRTLFAALAFLTLHAPCRLPAADSTALALQRGLFEEEANQNLPAAIQAYQALLTTHEQDRRLAATALYRLGECFRKLGRTNDALAQYETLVSRFADQSNLVALSRQNLAGLGALSAPTGSSTAAATPSTSALPGPRAPGATPLAALQAEAAGLEALLERARDLDSPQLRMAITAFQTDSLLNSLIESLARTDQKLVELRVSFAETHPSFVEQLKVRDQLEKHIESRTLELKEGLKIKAEILRRQIDLLRATTSASTNGTPGTASAAGSSEEEEEIRRIQAMIRNSPDLLNAPRAESGSGPAPLQSAAIKGQLEVARFLLANGAEVDRRGPLGRTALHYAAERGHKALVELLLDRGADPNAAAGQGDGNNQSGFTALHFAAAAGFRSVCETLLARKANPNARDATGETPLHVAAHREFPAIASLLLDRGADLQARSSFGATPLLLASRRSSPATAKLLLERGADPNLRADDGENPLLAAVRAGHADLVQELLRRKADPNAAGAPKPGLSRSTPVTPLAEAVANRNDAIAGLLLEAGANPNPPITSSGWTLLHESASRGLPTLVRLLLAKGAPPNAQTDDGTTPLIAAVAAPNTNALPIVESLIAAKADVNLRERSGISALFYAAKNRQPEVVARLLAAGAQVNTLTSDGYSPLTAVKSLSPPNLPPASSSFNSIPGRRSIRLPLPGNVPGTEIASDALSPESQSIIELLEKAGARSDLARLNAISTTRRGDQLTQQLRAGTNDWNHFTLFELLGFLFVRSDTPLPFPNLRQLSISRLDAQSGRTTNHPVDIERALESGDCAADQPLQWGDVLEVPEDNHLVNETWPGLSQTAYNTLQTCLSRTVQLTINGQSTNLVLRPFQSTPVPVNPPRAGWIQRMNLLRLQQWLRNTGRLLVSSDLSRVTVRRLDPATGNRKERVFDLSREVNQADDLWLRHGDEVEVPNR